MNAAISLEQANGLKIALDADILKAIEKFQDATGLGVSRVFLSTRSVIGSESEQTYSVTAEVRL